MGGPRLKQLRYRRVFTITGIAVHDPGIAVHDPGISVHDRPESLSTMLRNTQSLAVELRAADIGVSRVYTETRGIDRHVYQLKLFREQDVVGLCRWMYDGVPEGQRLTRKYETYRRALGLEASTTGEEAGGGGSGPQARGSAEPGRAVQDQPSAPGR